MKPARVLKVVVVVAVVMGVEEKVKVVAKVGTVVVAAEVVVVVVVVTVAAEDVADDLNKGLRGGRFAETGSPQSQPRRQTNPTPPGKSCALSTITLVLGCLSPHNPFICQRNIATLPHDLPTDHRVFFPAPVIFFRVTDIVVQPAAFLAVVGAFDDQLGHGGDVAQLDEVR